MNLAPPPRETFEPIQPDNTPPKGIRWINRFLIGFIFCAGIGLRAYKLDEPPVWVDEAESSINALTILDHGVPVDHYLGLPIFENTLIRPWPESEEYEFKDISYSDKGLAIYHSWIPLYSIAAALAAFGIQPDQAVDPPQVQHSPEKIGLRTAIPRIPSLLFSALFLVLAYLLGKSMYGTDAGIATMALTAFLSRMIWFGRQARYYSATLAFSALAGLAIWRVYTRGLWRDYLLLGVSFVLLFHSHILSFIILVLVWVVILPFSLRTPHWVTKCSLVILVGISGILPWMWYTGFLQSSEGIPKGWEVFSFPKDLGVYLVPKLKWIVVWLGGLLLVCGMLYFKERIPPRMRKPLDGLLEPLLFVTAWTLVAIPTFSLLIPAVSFSLLRINLVVSIPILLFVGISCAAVCRVLSPSRSSLLAFLLLVGSLMGSGRISTEFLKEPMVARQRWVEVCEWLKGHKFTSGTRFYSTPNQHLVITYLTGLPVQSIAPIRKSFLESYPRDIILIETISRYTRLVPAAIMKAANTIGLSMNGNEALAWGDRLMIEGVIEDLRGKIGKLNHPVYEPSPLSQILLKRQIEVTSHKIQEDLIEFLILHDFPILRWTDFWPAYFYRFSDAKKRMAEGLYFEHLLPKAEGFILPSSWIIYSWDRDGLPLTPQP